MARTGIRNRRVVIALIAACVTIFILSLLTPNPNFSHDTGDKDGFSEHIETTRFWRLPKFIFDELSNNAKYSTDDHDEYVQPHGAVYNSANYFINSPNEKDSTTRAWFFNGGKIWPKPSGKNVTPTLWPEQDKGDRILHQLMYVPTQYRMSRRAVGGKRRTGLKKILLYYGMKGFENIHPGRRLFLKDKCPVNTCALFYSARDSGDFDAILFRNWFTKPSIKRTANQVWILYLLESPMNVPHFKNLKHVINWTATYRHDSDIVTPYGKFVPYKSSSEEVDNVPSRSAILRRTANKTKKVAWFVSNCDAKNFRLQYAYELSHYISVDIYGACGRLYCPWTESCFEMLDRDYKFYLSFENSNCGDYITEKFFINGLRHNVIPIVMGASRDDYLRVAPSNSYIHVDDFASPKALAEYLHLLDQNDTMYNAYFSWKGTGEFINTYFWCRLCAMLHAPLKHKSYADIHNWWSKPGTCTVRKTGL